jgi:type VII secretion integral membrane protein EccD
MFLQAGGLIGVTQAGSALARIVIAAPGGRVDLALPEHLPVVSLLPAVLRHTGDDPALDGTRHGGWTLRRTDGTAIDLSRTLAAQSVRDGELLHLVPRRDEWPELAYDDVVEAIAAGARRRGHAWSAGATRITGLVAAATLLGLGLLVLLLVGGPRWAAGTGAIATSAVLLVAGVVLSRALGNSLAGGVAAGCALPYAFVGGLLVLADDITVGAPHLLLASALLVFASIVGYLGVVDGGRVFVAGATAGIFGALGAALGLGWLAPLSAAAVVVSAATLLLPALPLLAVRLGKLPLPALPRTTDDLLRDDPQPRREAIYRATERADEMLTGMIFGVATVAIVGGWLLAGSNSVAARLLAGIVAAAFLLRTRLLTTLRHRIPLFVAGLAGVGLLLLAITNAVPEALRVALSLPTVVIAAGLTATAGRVYSRRAPGPRLGRFGDVLDVVLQLAVVPVACSVLGLYGVLRAING